jgi:hypothetical protein
VVMRLAIRLASPVRANPISLEPHFQPRRPLKDYSMVQECADRYEVRSRPDGSATIHIEVPRRFRDLWVTKLSDLRASDDEIAEFEPPPGPQLVD